MKVSYAKGVFEELLMGHTPKGLRALRFCLHPRILAQLQTSRIFGDRHPPMISQQRAIRIISALAVLFFASSWSASGQGCPTIEIKTPDELVRAGDAFFARALVKGPIGSDSLKYDWTLTQGSIKKGHGSDTIEISSLKEQAGQTVEITVEITGLPQGCVSKATATVGVGGIGCYIPIDDFLPPKKGLEVRARVDNLFIQLERDGGMNMTAVIEMNFEADEPRRDRLLRITQITDAVKFRKYPFDRLVFLFPAEVSNRSTRFHIWPTSGLADLVGHESFIYGADILTQLPTLFKDKK